MKTIEDLRRRIANVRDVQSLVSTMKTMAAVRMRQYESAADAMNEYLRTVELGFQILQRAGPLWDGADRVSDQLVTGRGAIVFGSDQGLCGRFNEMIVEHVASRIRDNAHWRIIVVGHRAAVSLGAIIDQAPNATIEKTFRIPITVSAITGVMQQLMPIVDHWQRQGIRPIDVHFNERTSAATFGPETFQLYPISRDFMTRCQQREWNSRRLPIYTMNRRSLLAAVIRQYLFAGLYRACAESQASENASRIAAMQSASKNIDRRLGELEAEFNESRQAVITEEILDIAAGVEAQNSAATRRRTC